jgi:hypothetical protein
MSDNPSVTLAQLPDLRRKTDGLAKLLREQLTQYLETLRPLLAPERVFGKYAGGKVDSADSERALGEIQARYKEIAGRPFDLPVPFDPQWLSLVGNRLELYACEYVHSAGSGGEATAITMTSPVRWTVNYVSGATLTQAMQAMAGKDPRRQEGIRQFVVNALVSQAVMTRNPGVVRLLADLRYEARMEPCAGLNQLPLLTVSACVPSFRPPDELILAATGFSGVPAFIELIAVEGIHNLPDPMKERLAQVMR